MTEHKNANDTQSWSAAGATVAEYEHLNDDHMNLEAAFLFLCEESDCLPTDERRAWFMGGYSAYQEGRAVRIAGHPFTRGDTRSSYLATFRWKESMTASV